MGCTVDGPLYFAVGLLVGGTVRAVTTAAALLLHRRGERAAGVTVAVGAAAWTGLFMLLLIGTRSM